MRLDTDEGAERFSLSADGATLQRRGQGSTLGKGSSMRGRVGEVELIIYRDEHPLDTRYLALTAIHFSEERYRFLVRDLKRLLSLAAEDATMIHNRDDSWEGMVLAIYEQRLKQIEAYILSELAIALRLAEESGKDADERHCFRERQQANFSSRSEELEKIRFERLPDYQLRVSRAMQAIAQLRHRPLLKAIGPQHVFVVQPTLPLLRVPTYRKIYDDYRAMRKAIQSEELQRLEDLLDRMPIERTSKLYEYWIFLQIYNELRRMGFSDTPDAPLWSMIDKRSFRLCSNAAVFMVGDQQLYGQSASG